MNRIKVPVLLGPTACGKTEIAIRLAEDLGFQIVSCDSRQIYRRMDIGTAKPDAGQQARARTWLIDILEPSAGYSAFQFSSDARGILVSLASQDIRAMICGGTGMYFKCLSEGMGPQAPSDPAFRERMRARVAELGPDAVYTELQQIDPETARRLHPRDVGRTIRALEVFHATGALPSELRTRVTPPEFAEFCITVVDLPRAELYNRINARVDAMFRGGLWEEFRGLLAAGFTKESPGLSCLGYRELFDVMDGHVPLETAVEMIKHDTRRFAKRQQTWFRHQMNPSSVTIPASDYESIKRRFQEFLERRP